MSARIRISTCTAALAAVTIAVTGCSSSGGSAKTSSAPPAPTTSAASTPAPATSAAASTPAATSSSATPADAATTAAVTKAYTTFFGGAKTLPALEAALQNGDKLSAAIAAQSKNPVAKSLTAKVTAVALENPDLADVTFTLLSSGQPLLSNNPGKAVKVNGTWVLAADTFCGLLQAENQLPTQCKDPSIIALPTS